MYVYMNVDTLHGWMYNISCNTEAHYNSLERISRRVDVCLSVCVYISVCVRSQAAWSHSSRPYFVACRARVVTALKLKRPPCSTGCFRRKAEIWIVFAPLVGWLSSPVSWWSQEPSTKEAKWDANGITLVLYLCSQAIVLIRLKRWCLAESFLYMYFPLDVCGLVKVFWCVCPALSAVTPADEVP